MDIQDSLRSRRKSLGLSLEDIASALGVSANTVRNWECGRTAPAPPITEVPIFLMVYSCNTLEEFIELIREAGRRKNIEETSK